MYIKETMPFVYRVQQKSPLSFEVNVLIVTSRRSAAKGLS